MDGMKGRDAMRGMTFAIGIALAGLWTASPVLAGDRAVGMMLGDTWIRGGDAGADCIRILDELDRVEGLGDQTEKRAAYRQLRASGCSIQVSSGPQPSAEYGSYDGATFSVTCPRKRLPDGHCPTLGQSIDYGTCTDYAIEMKKAVRSGDEAREANVYRKARRLGCQLVQRNRPKADASGSGGMR
jgi:hypothetical protein